MTADRPVRIANCSGFYGDRLSAAREMVEGGPIDVLTGDWLAELTMLILWKAKARNADGGYATTFLTQMEQVLGTCVDRGIKVVTNAGGLNPAGCADEVRDIADKLGVAVNVAHIEGDDLLDRIDGLRPQPRQPRHRRAADRRPGERQRLPRRLGHRPRRSPTAPTSSCARGSPTPPSSSARRRGGGGGRRPTGTAWPAPSRPGTSSSAAPRRPAATSPSSTSCGDLLEAARLPDRRGRPRRLAA